MNPELEPTVVALNEARDRLLEHWENIVILVSRREGGFTKYNERRSGNDFANGKHAEVFAKQLEHSFLNPEAD